MARAGRSSPRRTRRGSTSALLNSVSCTAANACTTVGSYVDRSGNEVTLAERWNGKTWKIQPMPNPTGSTRASLSAISWTAKACIAVGSSDASGTLAERWNGKTWTIQSTPNPTGGLPVLDGVSCTAAYACTAVGGDDSGVLAKRWNGTAWTIQSTPNKGTGSRLRGVSCAAADACTAVGGYTSKTLAGRMLAYYWNGTDWTIQSTPKPRGSYGAALVGVSCTAANVCTAAGNFEKTRASGGQPLAERHT